MATLDSRGSVVYVGTLAKTLVPAIRLGFLVAPSRFVEAASHLRRSIDLQGDSMMEVAIAELYRNGTMRRHIRKAVKLYRERRDHLSCLLSDRIGEGVRFEVPSGGLAFWAHFAGADLDRVARAAEGRGLTMGSRLLFDPRAQHRSSTRLGFASLDFAEQERAVEILRSSLRAAEG